MLPYRTGVSVAGIIIQILRPSNRIALDHIIHQVPCAGASAAVQNGRSDHNRARYPLQAIQQFPQHSRGAVGRHEHEAALIGDAKALQQLALVGGEVVAGLGR